LLGLEGLDFNKSRCWVSCVNPTYGLYGDLQRKTRDDLDEEDEVGDSEALLRSPLALPKASADRINDASDEEE
jgi:hypothetical protein